VTEFQQYRKPARPAGANVQQAFVTGFRRVSLWCAALSVLAALAGFLAYPARRGQRSGPDVTAPPA